jgi:hypothetical protein
MGHNCFDKSGANDLGRATRLRLAGDVWAMRLQPEGLPMISLGGLCGCVVARPLRRWGVCAICRRTHHMMLTRPPDITRIAGAIAAHEFPTALPHLRRQGRKDRALVVFPGDRRKALTPGQPPAAKQRAARLRPGSCASKRRAVAPSRSRHGRRRADDIAGLTPSSASHGRFLLPVA